LILKFIILSVKSYQTPDSPTWTSQNQKEKILDTELKFLWLFFRVISFP